MEQRADETTTRLSQIAAEDAAPPATDDGQRDAVPAAGQDAGEANGRSPEEPAGWTPGPPVAGGPYDGEPDYPVPPASDAYPATNADDDYASTAVDSAAVDGAYAGPAVDDGYGAPGAERDYAGPAVDDGYGAPGAEPDYAAPSAPGGEFTAPPAENVYGSSGVQRDYSAPPYPSQVSPPAPEPGRTDRAAGWQTTTARVPRPQAVPKRPKATRKDGSPARQAHLTVARLEPWSVMKFSFMISLVCFVILFVAVALLYGTLAELGVFDAIQRALSNVTSGQGTTGVNASHWFSASTILGYTALLGALDVVLITAFATVGSVVYNLTSHLVGGVEVTLRETE